MVEMEAALMPESCNVFKVPPVENISTPMALNSRQKSTIPVLSETDTKALLINGSDICRIFIYSFIISDQICNSGNVRNIH